MDVWRLGANHWPVVCPPCPLPAAPLLALRPMEKGAAVDTGVTLLCGMKGWLPSTGRGLTVTPHLLLGLGSNRG